MSEENDLIPSPFRLAYITDVEGNLNYFLKFVESCPILTVQFQYRTITTSEFQADDDIQALELDFCQPTATDDHSTDNYHFVFGGDSVDKGTGDIRLNRCLVAFKKKHPTRVFLLVGNRDLNKLRFSAELSEAELGRDLNTIPGPHWDPSAPTLAEYLQRLVADKSQVDLESLHTRVNKLKYMLKHTLGCPKTFEFRRQELSILQNRSADAITDDQVVDNFIFEVQEGSLHDYFHHAQVAVIIGNTLFCHGAVDKDTMQFVPSPQSKFENPPSKPTPWKVIPNVHEWVDALNEFYQLGLKDHAERPYWNDDFTSRGGESLMALQNRPAMWGRSIISNCYGDGGCITTRHAAEHRKDPQRLQEETKNNPLCFEKVCSDPLDPIVASWLSKQGIQRVVVGHKPTGDCPSVLSSVYTGVEIVSADTSFSDTSSEDNRGAATGVVQLSGFSSTDNQLQLSGILQNGTSYSCAFARLQSKELATATESQAIDGTTHNIESLKGDIFLGRQLKDGDWWIKVRTGSAEDDLYCLTRGNGRKVEYKSVPASSIDEDMLTGMAKEFR
ncbi:unnamed protein product [Cylindrotheca closterium]|uniref:Calcineurin-like phosphoesterase domain-containing protein n=1 Tax=Cylindrotheca closterium TaxID=2856 RepID=A0AAD2FFS5_9STRA|nr:unnamed protein product [Cylindrotheca closterium]